MSDPLLEDLLDKESCKLRTAVGRSSSSNRERERERALNSWSGMSLGRVGSGQVREIGQMSELEREGGGKKKILLG